MNHVSGKTAVFAAAIALAVGVCPTVAMAQPAEADSASAEAQQLTAQNTTPASEFTYTIEADGVHITDYTGTSTNITIPATIGGNNVVYVKLAGSGVKWSKLQSIDVSNCTELTTLSCSYASLTGLDVSKNTKLTALSFHDNNVTSIDVSKNTALTSFDPAGNPLTSLDVSKNTALKTLICDRCEKLAALDVSKNTALTMLNCENCSIGGTLDVSAATALKELDCGGNRLTALDVSKNSALTTLSCYNNYITDTSALTKRFGTTENVILPQKSAASQFTDVDTSAWYVTDGWLDYVYANNLMGQNVTEFDPYKNITRGQVAVILYRYVCTADTTLEATYGSTTDKASYAKTAQFTDESKSVYYTAAINWAKDAKVLTGDGSTGYKTVRPNDPITREELCAMLARFSQKVEGASAAQGSVDYGAVKDMSDVSSWAKDSVKWCASYGIIGGVQKGSSYYMNPQDNTWRASMAKMITVTTRDVLK